MLNLSNIAPQTLYKVTKFHKREISQLHLRQFSTNHIQTRHLYYFQGVLFSRVDAFSSQKLKKTVEGSFYLTTCFDEKQIYILHYRINNSCEIVTITNYVSPHARCACKVSKSENQFSYKKTARISRLVTEISNYI